MKSQVNALLHVVAGLCEDVWRTYPSLRGSLSKDLDRLTLYCRNRGLTVFTLDLPHLESLLLAALEKGRLSLEGPYSRAVSSRTKVPRLFAGLWLRIFDKDGCLRQEVDVNALFFLRQLLVIGKRIEVVCSDDRIQAKVGEYHDIERKLRRPSFTWDEDDFRLADTGTSDHSSSEQSHSGDRHHFGGDLLHPSLFLCPVSEEHSEPVEESDIGDASSENRLMSGDYSSVHLAQAVSHHYSESDLASSLFREGQSTSEGRQRLEDIRLLSQIQRVADLIFGTFDPLDPVAYSGYLEERGLGTGFKHGPGAVAERLKNHEKSRFPN
jgi:hypothetical protein